MWTLQPNAGEENIGTNFVNRYELIYVVGMVAGRMTKKNEIRYVPAHPMPTILVSLDAFTLGARSVNPKVKVHVVWPNSLSDPPLEAEAAKGLIDIGVVILGSLRSSTATVVQTAEKNHVCSVGDTADVSYLALKGWLTGQRFDDDRRYGIKDGVIKLSSIGPMVPDAVKQKAKQLADKTGRGELAVFKGPIRSRSQIADSG
jgi:basic membrane protein A